MTKFYTRRGDDGTTGVLGEGRVVKHDLRMDTIGTLDEANAALGVARAQAKAGTIKEILLQVQRDLYQVMTEAAATEEQWDKYHLIGSEKIEWLEEKTDELSRQVQIPREFIVPGDSIGGAYLDVARTVVRRAERMMSALLERGDTGNPHLLGYLNRLSSLIFVLEIYENQASGNETLTMAKG